MTFSSTANHSKGMGLRGEVVSTTDVALLCWFIQFCTIIRCQGANSPKTVIQDKFWRYKYTCLNSTDFYTSKCVHGSFRALHTWKNSCMKPFVVPGRAVWSQINCLKWCHKKIWGCQVKSIYQPSDACSSSLFPGQWFEATLACAKITHPHRRQKLLMMRWKYSWCHVAAALILIMTSQTVLWVWRGKRGALLYC